MHFVLCWFFMDVAVVLLRVFHVETHCNQCTTLLCLVGTVSQSFKIVLDHEGDPSS